MTERDQEIDQNDTNPLIINDYSNASEKDRNMNQSNNLIYQKPKVKNNLNVSNNSNINQNILKEISKNNRENEIKISRVNQTMIDLINSKKEDLNNTRSYLTQMNEIEKLQQENAMLKADSLIYREDLTHLNAVNKKLSEEYEIVKNKIKGHLSKIDENEKILMSKNYEINQLTETISNLNITERTNCNNTSLLYKLNTNRNKDQLIYEINFNIKNLNNEKLKIEVEKKILEEKYNSLLDDKEKAEKNDENYNINTSNLLNNFDAKIQKLQFEIENLSKKNHELKIYNQKYNNNIIALNKEKEELQNKYDNKKEQCAQLEKDYKNLEMKFNQLLYDRQKRSYIMENLMKDKQRTKEKENKIRKKQNEKKEVINDLYNKIQMLKLKVQTEREND